MKVAVSSEVYKVDSPDTSRGDRDAHPNLGVIRVKTETDVDSNDANVYSDTNTLRGAHIKLEQHMQSPPPELSGVEADRSTAHVSRPRSDENSIDRDEIRRLIDSWDLLGAPCTSTAVRDRGASLRAQSSEGAVSQFASENMEEELDELAVCFRSPGLLCASYF
jgi:hypothetical protein